jgi:hypothetical protein
MINVTYEKPAIFPGEGNIVSWTDGRGHMENILSQKQLWTMDKHTPGLDIHLIDYGAKVADDDLTSDFQRWR